MTKPTRATDISPEALLEAIQTRGTKGLTVVQLVNQLASERRLERSEARRLLRPALKELQRQGRIVLGRGKRYFVPEASNLLTGRLRRVAGGHLELAVEGDAGPPVRIPPRAVHGALVGDTVMVRLEAPRREARAAGVRAGVVVKVVERSRREVVGRWMVGGGRPHVRPLDRRLRFKVMLTSSQVEGEPEEGELVAVSIDTVDAQGENARGVLLERLGRVADPGVVERVVLREHGIPEAFSGAALAEAERLPGAIAAADLARREDLRERPVITIDGATARDFDDAVSARPGRGSEIEVEVHIADVSHFVRPGTPLDEAATERGTSVYLPGLCVPMLPERLSNDLGSLREAEDRLCFTVRYVIDRKGEIRARQAFDSVIRSRRRCTYDEVAAWLELPRTEWPRDTEPFADSLALLAEAAARLGSARREHGSLDFDLAEPELILDPEGRVVAIQPGARNRAHRLIEELMVAANRCVAEIMMAADQPALYRVHDEPDPVRVEELKQVMADLGLQLRGDSAALPPAALQALLEAAAGRPEERLVDMLVLRTLARALYSPEPRGHYALTTDEYLHFTSPIRRYPDLVVHRMLRRLLAVGRLPDGAERAALESELEALGESCSAAERRAEAAERAAVEWKTVIFLREREGEIFAGHISGVTDFGLFVRLDEISVDGMIHLSELNDDYYSYDDRRHRLVGERSGRVWRLGDAITVRLARVDLEAMQLGFLPVGVTPDARAARKTGRPKSRSRRRQNVETLKR
jgi:ribonuclease R